MVMFNHSDNRPQCQLCGKFGHIVITCYHRFDINFQGSDVLASSLTKSTFHTATSSDVHAMMVSPSSTINDSWFLDTGATHHLTRNRDHLVNSHSYQVLEKATIGDGKKLSIFHVGSTCLHTPHKTFRLQQVLHVPHLATNLISVSKFCQDNNSFFEFHPTFFFIKIKNT